MGRFREWVRVWMCVCMCGREVGGPDKQQEEGYDMIHGYDMTMGQGDWLTWDCLQDRKPGRNRPVEQRDGFVPRERGAAHNRRNHDMHTGRSKRGRALEGIQRIMMGCSLVKMARGTSSDAPQKPSYSSD